MYAHDCRGLSVAEDSATPLSGDHVVGNPKEAPLLGHTQKRFVEYSWGIGVKVGGMVSLLILLWWWWWW